MVMRFGALEIGLIIVLAIILFGGAKISGLGKALGKSIKDFRSEVKDDTPAVPAPPVEEAGPKA
jgi:sec-independent protein translocase protein TatA